MFRIGTHTRIGRVYKFPANHVLNYILKITNLPSLIPLISSSHTGKRRTISFLFSLYHLWCFIGDPVIFFSFHPCHTYSLFLCFFHLHQSENRIAFYCQTTLRMDGARRRRKSVMKFIGNQGGGSCSRASFVHPDGRRWSGENSFSGVFFLKERTWMRESLFY